VTGLVDDFRGVDPGAGPQYFAKGVMHHSGPSIN